MRALLDELAGDDAPLLPDLGPGALMDQLTVLVHDACAAGDPGADDLSSRLRGLLADLS
ncbi:hypothetical protein [Phycicoccus sp. Root563]|uniref:hypothetical protein n=1 Tax=Phycicoccus sp. Root563 TaxID=1736562 RepID=UPI000B04DA59|nr:hypothetical protein [Phycicoccus sp. Root563]